MISILVWLRYLTISILHNDSKASSLVWFKMSHLLYLCEIFCYEITFFSITSDYGTFFKKLLNSKFIICFSFSLDQKLGIFFHSWFLLRISSKTIINKFKYYHAICDLMPCCEEMS